FSPVKYTATESKKVYFCGCKLTASQPLCDGSHK
ncbi:MAG: CDGSH iron-sulfur domain-containing protein, partial [Sinobacterium sp.]